MPAQAGIQLSSRPDANWIPACAGMTIKGLPMNAVLKPDTSIHTLFDRVAARAAHLVETTAEQRVAKLQRLLRATLEARPAIHAAANRELGLCTTDVDAQLLMVKAEIEF